MGLGRTETRQDKRKKTGEANNLHAFTGGTADKNGGRPEEEKKGGKGDE